MTGPNVDAQKKSRGLRWLLIGSLTLNLLVAGVVGGAFLRHAGEGMPPPPPRHLGFGTWTAGLDREDHKALREAFRARGTDFRAALQQDRADRAALIAALKAQPFDPAALDAVADRLQSRSYERSQLSEELIRAHIRNLSDAERRVFAERLQEAMKPRAPGQKREPSGASKP